MNKIAIFAVDGFEDMELITPIDVFTRESIEFELFSVDNKLEIKGKFSSKISSTPISEFNTTNFSGLLLPGGSLELAKKEIVNKVVRDFHAAGKDLYAICAAPIILWNNDVLKDKRFTAWPGLNLSESTGMEIEVAGNIITGKDFRSSLKWTDAIVKKIKNR